MVSRGGLFWVVLIAALIFVFNAEASLSPPPPPPQGWEQEITPGFEPSIESTIVRHFYNFSDQLPAYVKGWGPAAVPVLIRLYRDERWSPYRNAMLKFLAASDSEEAKQFYKDRVLSLLEKTELSEKDARELNSLFFKPITKMAGPEVIGAATKRLRSLAEEKEKKPVPEETYAFVYFLAGASAEAMAAVEECAQHGNEMCRGKCGRAIASVDPAKGTKLLEALYTQTTDEELKKNLDVYIASYGGRARALEPMSVILNQERKSREK